MVPNKELWLGKLEGAEGGGSPSAPGQVGGVEISSVLWERLRGGRTGEKTEWESLGLSLENGESHTALGSLGSSSLLSACLWTVQLPPLLRI